MKAEVGKEKRGHTEERERREGFTLVEESVSLLLLVLHLVGEGLALILVITM